MDTIRFLLKNKKTEIVALILSLLMINGATVYRLYALNTSGIIFSLSLVIIITLIIVIFSQKYKYFRQNPLVAKIPPRNIQKKDFWVIGAYLVFFIVGIITLWVGRTDEAINSPWLVVSPLFFGWYALATFTLFWATRKQIAFIPFLISLHYFLTFSIALIIYKIGYGFDPFVHQATVDLIIKKGAVDPKPFYYLGQYALEVITHKITLVSPALIDKLLAPILAAVFLPAVLLKFTKKWFENKNIGQLAIITLLAIPCSLFIVTTPQNLAYLFLILTIIFGLLCAGPAELAFTYLLALATMAIHPLAGIPALLFAILISIYHSDYRKIKPFLYSLFFFLTALALPLTFYFLEKSAAGFGKIFSFHWATLREMFIFHNPGAENFILNFVQFYAQNISLTIFSLALLGIIITIINRKECQIFFLPLLMAGALFISYLLSLNLDFSYLINYEREIFSNRILTLAIIFLLPFFLTALYWLWEKILLQDKKIIIIFMLAATMAGTTALYVAYPRADRYANSHGYATSREDLDAVKWIEDNAGGDYVALANQQVSAAALATFGFDRYYQGDIYFYPVPTGGELYQYYLDMVYEAPDRETALEAMNLAGVNEVYFVLNKYWWAFPKILAEAKLSADSWTEHANGKIYIFKYTK